VKSEQRCGSTASNSPRTKLTTLPCSACRPETTDMSNDPCTGWRTARTRNVCTTNLSPQNQPQNRHARQQPRIVLAARSTLNKCSSHRPQPLRPPSKQTMHCSHHTPWPEVLRSDHLNRPAVFSNLNFERRNLPIDARRSLRN
jgi:hypothetical protein